MNSLRNSLFSLRILTYAFRFSVLALLPEGKVRSSIRGSSHSRAICPHEANSSSILMEPGTLLPCSLEHDQNVVDCLLPYKVLRGGNTKIETWPQHPPFIHIFQLTRTRPRSTSFIRIFQVTISCDSMRPKANERA